MTEREEFCDKWRKHALAVAKGMGLRPDDADDAAQEAVIACWKQSLDGPMSDNLEATVIRRAVISYVRKDKRQSGGAVYLEDMALENGESPLASHDDRSAVETSILSGLSEREKAVAEALADGWTYREIGKALGVSHVRVGQIVEEMRERLTKEHGFGD